VDAEDYFIGPDIDITRLHILQPGDLLTAIRIPPRGGRTFYSRKFETATLGLPADERGSAMVASAIVQRAMSAQTIDRIRISVNAAAAPLAFEGG